MVEIRYGEHYEVADLVGKSVAEVREQYKLELGIPDKAQALLNGKQVTKKLEPEMKLNEGDELSFEEKQRSRKGLILVGAFLLALALTGGMFAFAYTTVSITGGTLNAAGTDFATANVSAPTPWNWWHSTDNLSSGLVGRTSGSMTTVSDNATHATLFTVYPSDNYTGDIEIKVYLANAGHLRYAFKHFNMKLDCTNSEEIDEPSGHEFQLLTLENAEVLFHREYSAGWYSNPCVIRLQGGSWHSLAYQPIAWGSGHQCTPQLYCEVQPR